MNYHPVVQNRTIHRTVLKNGLVVIAVENNAADIVAGRIFVRAGGLHEPTEQAGISHLLAAVLTKGTEQLSSLEIAERVESVGSSLGTDAASDYFLLSLKTVSADFANILKLAGELLRSPSFPEAEVELERRLTLQNIRSQQEQPFAVAMEQLRRSMYGNHPYALSGLGTESTVSQLDRSALQHYHQTHFRPDNIVVSIVGRITPESAIDLVDKVLGDWEIPEAPLSIPSFPPIPHQPQTLWTAQETQQSIVMVGYQAPAVSKPTLPNQFQEYCALKLLNTYLGNGLSSRLFVELREKQGLAYEVSAFYPTRLQPSQFAVYLGTAPDNTEIALAGLRREVERLCTTALTPEELQVAKNKLLGQYALGKQTNAQIAQVMGWYESLGLGLAFDQQFQDGINQTTIAEAQAAACQYFTQPYISLVGPEAAVQPLSILTQ